MDTDKKLKLDSKIENISFVEKYIEDISNEYKISSEVYGNILVALIEAVNNAILHGNKLDADKLVQVSFLLENDFFKFKIRDEGPGFNFTRIPDPTLPENIEKPHGRGIYLMNHLADKINFADNGAEVELLFKVR